MSGKQSSFIDIIKPRILMMQWVTVSMGFFLALTGQAFPWATYAALILGTTGISAGAAILNNLLERDSDKKMDRTKYRVLPSGRVSPIVAGILGLGLSALGTGVLWMASPLTALVGFATLFLYVAIYTPLKRMTWLNTIVGAVPGALPPLGGWAAATGSFSWMGWGLFSILFFWQLPHFFAIDWMYKEDYKNAGMVMLSRYDSDGRILSGLGMLFTAALTLVTLFPILMGKLGMIYGVGAMALNVALLWRGWQFMKARDKATAKKVLLATVIYLPVLLIFITLDRWF
jgi:heme o synthase